jgi:hypothetical protein
MINSEVYKQIIEELKLTNTTLVAVSKTKPAADIQALYNLGQLDFGENYVQELVDKETVLPKDVRWHFIGHLQSNKVKYIAPFVHLIHGVDSYRLLQEINKQAKKINRTIDCLIQIHIATEETKYGFDGAELETLFSSDLASLTNIRIKGMMGMASFSDDATKVRGEFIRLKSFFDKYKALLISNCQLTVISMGMSGDYRLAIEEGSTMVRIGSLLFGNR